MLVRNEKFAVSCGWKQTQKFPQQNSIAPKLSPHLLFIPLASVFHTSLVHTLSRITLGQVGSEEEGSNMRAPNKLAL